MYVALDSGVVGLITNPVLSEDADSCRMWLKQMSDRKHVIVLPEIIDYELRRELIRAGKRRGLARLNDFQRDCVFQPLNSDAMLKAAEFWAEARRRGKPTADRRALDIDVILAAQASQYRDAGEFIVIATMNAKHLSQFVPAEHWKDIHPI